jgi:hypothetical protein
MKYAIHRTDGGISIMECVPVRAIKDGKEYKVERLKREGETYRVFVQSEDQTAVIGNVSRDWRADGWAFECNPPEAEIAKWVLRSREQVVSIHPISGADIPQDRTFRDGWKLDGKTIGHDMAKCREIHKDRLREARAPKLAALDVDYQRADEDGDSARKRDIAKRKQELRDVTKHPDIEAAKTVEELKAVWPDALA